MKITIDSRELSNLIYSLFIGDCECRTACYKHCNDINEYGRYVYCQEAIERTLLDYLKEEKE